MEVALVLLVQRGLDNGGCTSTVALHCTLVIICIILMMHSCLELYLYIHFVVFYY